MFTGVNDVLYRNGSACGLQYKVTCVGAAVKGQHNPCRRRNNTVTVTVTDSCTPEPDAPGRKPEPCPTFVLSKPTFRSIAALSAGVVSVSYELINL
ncbi:unnamed protein product [Linum tenue]|uniref:Expansin-like EG45 domain-containing protein n=1 Tax=Linum tenue TaxID=586396 RepID=A0AAV0LY42_9ROSI|nr:unnamed protein product [Linum tenue]